MLTFAEEILLLMLDDDGAFLPIRGGAVEYILAGAVLMDLAFANRIDTDPEQLVSLDSTPTGNPMFDQALAYIANSGETKNTKGWIETLAGQETTGIRQQALASLIERGILESQDKKFLWVFRSRRYPTIDGRVEREVKLRMEDVLLSNDMPDPRDVALICLVDACDILSDIFSEREMERAQPRIEQLRVMDLIGREVGSVIADIEQSITMAMAQVAH
jgi:Golgi phosphoprotein 3